MTEIIFSLEAQCNKVTWCKHLVVVIYLFFNNFTSKTLVNYMAHKNFSDGSFKLTFDLNRVKFRSLWSTIVTDTILGN